MSESAPGSEPQPTDAAARDVAYALRKVAELDARVRSIEAEAARLERLTSEASSRAGRIESEVVRIRARIPSGASDCLPAKAGTLHLHRGSNNSAMKAYAEEVGAAFVIEANRRCSFCNHMGGAFVVKGSKALCQVSFAKGVRFEG